MSNNISSYTIQDNDIEEKRKAEKNIITGKTFKAKIYSELMFINDPKRNDVPLIVESITARKIWPIFSKINFITGTFKIQMPIKSWVNIAIITVFQGIFFLSLLNRYAIPNKKNKPGSALIIDKKLNPEWGIISINKVIYVIKMYI